MLAKTNKKEAEVTKKVSSLIVACIAVLGVVAGARHAGAQGFAMKAIDPATRKLTSAYAYSYKEDAKDQTLVMEHGVEGIEYKTGKLTLTGVDKKVLTSFKSGDNQLTVNFKAMEQRTDKDDKTLNVLVLASDEGSVFEFSVTPSSRMLHTLTEQKGDIVAHLKKKGGKPIKKEKTK